MNLRRAALESQTDETRDFTGLNWSLRGSWTISDVCAGAAVAAAAAISRAHVSTSGPRVKSCPEDLVTDVDILAEAAAIAYLQRHGSIHDVLETEESGIINPSGGGIRWVVDGLDGTANFVEGSTDYAVSVGAIAGGRPVAGAICRPFDNVLVRTSPFGGQPPLIRSTRDVLLASIGIPYPAAARAEARYLIEFAKMSDVAVERTGSASCDFLQLLAGNLDVYVAYGLAAWDLTAGAALIDGAGGNCETLMSPSGVLAGVYGDASAVSKMCTLLQSAGLRVLPT